MFVSRPNRFRRSEKRRSRQRQRKHCGWNMFVRKQSHRDSTQLSAEWRYMRPQSRLVYEEQAEASNAQQDVECEKVTMDASEETPLGLGDSQYPVRLECLPSSATLAKAGHVSWLSFVGEYICGKLPIDDIKEPLGQQKLCSHKFGVCKKTLSNAQKKRNGFLNSMLKSIAYDTCPDDDFQGLLKGMKRILVYWITWHDNADDLDDDGNNHAG